MNEKKTPDFYRDDTSKKKYDRHKTERTNTLPEFMTNALAHGLTNIFQNFQIKKAVKGCKFHLNTEIHDHHFFVSLFLALSLFNPWFGFLTDMLAYFIGINLLKLRDIDHLVFFTLGTILTINTHISLYIAWIITYSAFHKKTMNPFYFRYMAYAYVAIRNTMTDFSLSNGCIGYNSEDTYTGKIKNLIVTLFDTIQEFTILSNSATFISDTNFNTINIKPPKRVFLTPKDAYRSYQTATKINLSLYILVTMLVVLVLLHPINLVFVAIVLLTLGYWKQALEPYTPSQPTQQHRRGTYRLQKTIFGIVYENAVGYSHEGVLHTPYHYSKTLSIEINGITHRPSFADEENDLTTYGGQPQLHSPNTNINQATMALVTSSGIVNYEIPILREGSVVTFPNYTSPGESGSPIFVFEDGQHFLIGLAGLWVRKGLVESTGLIITHGIDTKTEAGERIREICRHPGFGKTRRLIPELCSAHFDQYRGGSNAKIIISGPTRNICEDMYKNLVVKFPGQVASRVSSLSRKNDSLRIQVMAHDTLMLHLIMGSKAVNGIKTIVLDEAHTDSLSTSFIKYWCENNSDVKLYQLSATFKTHSDDSSNYQILNLKITNKDIPDIITYELDQGHKIAIFVSGAKGLAGSHTIRSLPVLRNRRVIDLNRESYPRVKPIIDDGNYDVIVTTNIAECGVNLDIDAVIDLCQNFYFKASNNYITGTSETISWANRIQRRGRVGRNKAGTYYYIKEPEVTIREDTASEFETWLLLKDTDWPVRPHYDDNGAFPRVTTKHAELSIKGRIPLTEAIMTYDDNGNTRTKEGIQDIINSMIGGPICITQCPEKDKDCFCTKNTYKWWDDRIHGFLKRKLVQNSAPPQTENTEWSTLGFEREAVRQQELRRRNVIRPDPDEEIEDEIAVPTTWEAFKEIVGFKTKSTDATPTEPP